MCDVKGDKMFGIPVVLFIFKRLKAVDVVNRIGCVQPRKLYIIADGGRTPAEIEECNNCRKAVESAVTWDCEIIRNYATTNRGVFENIGLGAKWVFEHEERAIFLEDDNLPAVSFFGFCQEMLKLYADDERILWICGTNYLGNTKYTSDSYYFTRHMFPCGWASWSTKFIKFYDPYVADCIDEKLCENIRYIMNNNKLFRQYKQFWRSEKCRIDNGLKPLSWDYQMDFAIKSNNLLGIVPSVNLIQNIGIDQFSIHGGSSAKDIMTRRFCSMNSYEIEFPLTHPNHVMLTNEFERAIGKILLYPITLRVKNKSILALRKLLRIPAGQTIHGMLRRRKND